MSKLKITQQPVKMVTVTKQGIDCPAIDPKFKETLINPITIHPVEVITPYSIMNAEGIAPLQDNTNPADLYFRRNMLITTFANRGQFLFENVKSLADKEFTNIFNTFFEDSFHTPYVHVDRSILEYIFSLGMYSGIISLDTIKDTAVQLSISYFNSMSSAVNNEINHRARTKYVAIDGVELIKPLDPEMYTGIITCLTGISLSFRNDVEAMLVTLYNEALMYQNAGVTSSEQLSDIICCDPIITNLNLAVPIKYNYNNHIRRN